MNYSRWLKLENLFFIFVLILINTLSAFAGPNRTTYQAKIVKPDGYPLEAANVNFKFTILDPGGVCILYSETYSSVNMTGTGGLISFALGSGVKTFPASATTFENIFSNITPSITCDAGGPPSYSPLADDSRKVVMQFHDGAGWQTLPAMAINAVPYAMYANDAQKLGGVSATSFVQRTEIPTCSGGEAMFYNGASFSCVTVGGGGSVSAAAITAALGYTPANGASITAVSGDVSALASYAANVSSTVFSVSSTVRSLENSFSSFQATTAASFAAIAGSGISTFNGSTSATQSLGNSLSGTTPAFVTANGVHTLNIPYASVGTTTAGLISNSDYSLFSTVINKITSSAASIAQVLGYTPADQATVTTLSSTVGAVSTTANSALALANAVSSSVGSLSSNKITSSAAVVAQVLGYTAADQVTVAAVSTTANSALALANSKITSSAASIAQVLGYVPAASGGISSQWSTSGTTVNYLTGRVGVGTVNPEAQLAVETTDAGNHSSALLLRNRSNIQNTGVALDFSADADYLGARIVLNRDQQAGPRNSLRFYVNGSFGAANNDDLVIQDSGNVGFGTSNPTSRLHINENAATSTYAKFTNSAAPINGLDVGINSVGQGVLYQRENNDLVIGTSDTQRMIVKNSGLIGIGLTSPMTTLDVSGAIRIGMDAVTCSAGYAGSIRYNAGLVEYCNGTTWSAFGVAGAGITNLNGSVSGSQTFANGIAGTQPAYISLNGVHTLNIPYAASAGVTAGLLSYADYTSFAGKANAASVTALSSTVSNLSTSMSTLSSNLNTVSATATNALNTANAVSSTVNSLAATVANKIASSAASISEVLGYTPAASGSSINSQWVTSGTGIHFITGNVGVGNQNPTSPLHVLGSSTSSSTPWATLEGGGGVVDNIALRLFDRGTGVGNNNILEFAHSINASATPVGTSRIRSVNVGGNAASGSSMFFETASDSVGTWNSNQLVLNRNGNVGIGTNNPQASLDVSSTTTGFLMPRLTTAQRNAIASPTNGLMVYDTDLKGLYVYQVNTWKQVGGSSHEFRAGQVSGSVTFTSGAMSDVAFTNEEYDVSNAYNNSTGTYTVPEDGTYVFSWTVYLVNSSKVTLRHSELWVDGTAKARSVEIATASSNEGALNGTALLRLVAGQVVKIRLLQVSSDSSAAPAGANTLPLVWNFSGGRLGGSGGQSSSDNLGNHSATQNINLASYKLVGNGGSEGINIDSSGRVGIAKASPATALDVSGAIRVGMESASCSATYAGAIRYNAGIVEFCNGSTWGSLGGADASTLNSSGNITMTPVGSVIVSSTTASTNSQTGALVVKGGLGIAGNTYSSGTILTSSNIEGNGIKSKGTTAYLEMHDTDTLYSANPQSALVFRDSANSQYSFIGPSNGSMLWNSFLPIELDTSAGTDLYVSTSGRVGIGTSNPTGLLSIAGTGATDLRMESSSSSGSTIRMLAQNGMTYLQSGVSFGANSSADMRFTSMMGTSTWMTIQASSGNLGIGTTNPLVGLHVQKGDANGASLFIQKDSSSNGLTFGTHAGSNRGYIQGSNSTNTALSELMLNPYGNSVGINVTSATARLHIASGTASMAPMKLTSGVLLTAAQPGAIEYNGFDLYFTDGAGSRRTLATATANGMLDGVSVVSSTSDISLWPAAGNSVIVSATTASTNSQTGALIVKGGMGISGALYSSGTIITSSNIQGASITATSGMLSPYITGSTVSGGSLTLEASSHAGNGPLLLNPRGGRVGIGTVTPIATLSIEDAIVPGIQIKKTGAAALDTINFINNMDAVGEFWIATGANAVSAAVSDRLFKATNEGNYEFYGQRVRAGNDKSGIISIKTEAASTGGNRNEGSLEFYTRNANLEDKTGYLGFETNDLNMSLSSTYGSVIFAASSTEMMRMTSNGVGIGMSTPGARLVIKGAGISSATAALNVTNSVNSSKFYVGDDGNVGIGTATPLAILEVTKMDPVVRIKNSGGDIGGMYLQNSGNSAYLGMYNPGGSSFGVVATNTSKAYLGFNSAGQLGSVTNTFTTGAPGVAVFRSVFDDGNGNMGVASAAPGARLVVKGAGNTAATTALAVTDSSNNTKMIILNDGKVGFGTDTPKGAFSVVHSTSSTTVPGRGQVGTASLYLSNSSETYGMIAGVLTDGTGYIQAQYVNGVNQARDLILQPNGGDFNAGLNSIEPLGTEFGGRAHQVLGASNTLLYMDNANIKARIFGDFNTVGRATAFSGAANTNYYVFGASNTLTTSWQYSHKMAIGFQNNVPDGNGTSIVIGSNLTAAAASGVTIGMNTPTLNVMATGQVGIGTTSPNQALTVSGIIESTNGGIKFPDATTQSTAYNDKVTDIGAGLTTTCPMAYNFGVNNSASTGWTCYIDTSGLFNSTNGGNGQFATQLKWGYIYNQKSAFAIEDSADNSTWTTLIHNTNSGTFTLSASTRRYVRFRSLDSSGFGNLASVSVMGGPTSLSYGSNPSGWFMKETWRTVSGHVVVGPGNVGIGTATPLYKFDVVGGARLGAANGSYIYTERVDSDFDIYQVPGSTKRGLSIHAAQTGGDVLSIYANNAGSAVPGLHVDNGTGNVGVGVTDAPSKLTVGGDVSVAGNVIPNTTGSKTLGTGALRWNYVYLTNAPDVSSDIRLKKDVKNSDLGLDFINNLRPVSWTWKDPKLGLTAHYGVIAQEAEAAIKKARGESSDVIVARDEKSGSYSVRYQELIAPVIKAIQELYHKMVGIDRQIASVQEENAELKARVEKTEKENEELKKRLDRIEKALLEKK